MGALNHRKFEPKKLSLFELQKLMIVPYRNSFSSQHMAPFFAQIGILGGFSYVGWKVYALDPILLSKWELIKRVALVGISTISQILFMTGVLEINKSPPLSYLYHALSFSCIGYLLFNRKLDTKYGIAILALQFFVSNSFLNIRRIGIYREISALMVALRGSYQTQRKFSQVQQEVIRCLVVLNRDSPPFKGLLGLPQLVNEWVKFITRHINQRHLDTSQATEEFYINLTDQQKNAIHWIENYQNIIDSDLLLRLHLLSILRSLGDDDLLYVNKYINEIAALARLSSHSSVMRGLEFGHLRV